MKENFKIINLTKYLLDKFDKYLTNFPNKDIELKKDIYTTSYEMLKLLYECNSSNDLKLRVVLQDKLVSYVKFLDFMISRCYKKQIINQKRYLKFGEDLEYIYASLIKWKATTVKSIS